MHRRKWIIWLFSAAFAAVIFLCARLDPAPVAAEGEGDRGPGLWLNVASAEGRERIRLWNDGQGRYFGFLPGYASSDRVSFSLERGSTVRLNGVPVRDGDSCEELQPGVEYRLEWENGAETSRSGILILSQSGEIPALYLDVRSGNMHYIHSNKGNEEPGSMRLHNGDGTISWSGDLESVKGRGNATWDWEKKPYNLKLRAEADLLGLGAASDWVLLANVYDPSSLRNKIVYDAADRIGLECSPGTRWVDLYLNGEYAGLYLLSEKNEIHPQRVDLDPRTGNLVSIEKQDRLWEYEASFVTPGGVPVRIRSTPDQEGAQQTLLALERAAVSPEGVDPQTGKSWQEMIDEDSWARKYLVEEVFGNLDAGSISQFFYWDADGEIFAGPVWDYDVSMGNRSNWQLRDVNMLYSGRPHLWNSQDVNWYSALYEQEEFRSRVIRLYREQFRPLLEELIRSEIDTQSSLIRAAALQNTIRWNSGDPAEETEQLKTYLRERMEFLDGLWLEGREYRLVQMYINWHVMACYALEPGECLPYWEVPAGTDTIHYVGWYDASTGEPFDFSKPVTEDTLVWLKEEGSEAEPSSGTGGLSSKILYIPASVLVLLGTGLLGADRIRRKRPADNRERTREQEAV